jgi:exosome complex exonuclease RRP6
MTDATSSQESEASLSKLLAALGSGARAVQNLPLDDEFAFQSSFPEFSQSAADGRERLMDVLALVDPCLRGRDANDPQVWETCAEICDALIEQAEIPTQQTTALQDISIKARGQARGSYGRMMQGLVEMAKPQDTYNIQPNNHRLEPFVPKVHPSKPFSVSGPLDLTLVQGHGLETRFGNKRKVVVSPNIVAPSHHVPHVYQKEIESFSYLDWQLEAPDTKPSKIPIQDDLQATWVDNKEELAKLSKRLETADMVAVDLEAHSYHSFSGIICLMQFTIKDENGKSENYLIDTLKLWHSINAYLAEMFANPAIVKVMHGADSDIQWLQRDFGIYVVNLLDTGMAARELKLQSAGLAYLLQHYANVTADKTHQLSDWRQRPLPDAMKTYAIMDTHYLLDIVPHLLYDLKQNEDTSIQKVLDASRQVCLIRHDKEPFNPLGYKNVMSGRRKKTGKKTESELSALQEKVLASLYEWRDATARECDESLHSVCSDQALLRLSMACPTTVTALQSLMNPLPPFLLRFSQEVLDRIKECFEEEETNDVFDEESRNVSAFFKPAEAEDGETRGILSPVLGTEEMYQQAGWLTPQVDREQDEAAEVVTTTTDDDDGDKVGKKPMKLLVVDEANKQYQSKQYTTHSLELGSRRQGSRGRTADGMGPARAAQDKDLDMPALQEEARRAQLHAVRIRTGMSRDDDLLGLISPTAELEAGTSGEPDDDDEPDKQIDEIEDFQIPKSMREIYKISNRNRRNRNPSPPNSSERSGMLAKPMAVDTLEGAEAVLAASGHYANIKRARAKSEGSGDTEGSARPSRDDDAEFMKEIGWIQSKEELQAMVNSRRDDGEDAGDVDTSVEDGDRETPTDGGDSKSSRSGKEASPFDYSTVGNIGVYPQNAGISSNPFFAGAAVAGAPEAQNGRRSNSSGKRNRGRGRSGRGRERPDRKGGRSTVYKKC